MVETPVDKYPTFQHHKFKRSKKKGKAKKIYEMLFTITYWFSILSNLILEISFFTSLNEEN